MTNIILQNGAVYLPHRVIKNGSVWIENHKIKAITEGVFSNIPTDCRVIDATGKRIVAGFMDIHVMGGGGHLSIDGTTEAILGMAHTHAQFGTTSMLPTTVSLPEDILLKALKSIAGAMSVQSSTPNPQTTEGGKNPTYKGSKILGAHFESCFLSVGKRGAHVKEFLRKPDVVFFQKCQDAANGQIKLLSIATELENAYSVVEYAQKQGVVVSFAHSEGSFEDANLAISKGVHLCTHLFNAMTPLSHRALGGVGAFLSNKKASVQIIADGAHVLPPALQLTYKVKGADKIVIVTDALAPAGTDATSYHFIGRDLIVNSDGCFLQDGTLAGSMLTMNRGVELFFKNTDASLREVLNMVSLNPARVMGLDKEKGSLEVGKDADVVVMTKDFEVDLTMVEGQIVFEG
jgi:N-acetylglucosamine-6-phosphate deacetylase